MVKVVYGVRIQKGNYYEKEKYNFQKTFHEVKNLITSGSSHSTYELIEFDNGEMILVNISPIPEGGEYIVQGIKIIPDEMKDLFK